MNALQFLSKVGIFVYSVECDLHSTLFFLFFGVCFFAENSREQSVLLDEMLFLPTHFYKIVGQ